MKMFASVSSHKKKGQALLVSLILLLFAAGVTGAVASNAMTRYRSVAISTGSMRASDVAEAGLAIAMKGIRSCFADGFSAYDCTQTCPNLPVNASDVGVPVDLWNGDEKPFPGSVNTSGWYTATATLIYTDKIPGDGQRNDVDYSTEPEGSGDYRYLIEVESRVDVPGGGEVSGKADGAVTCRLFTGSDFSMDERIIGHKYVYPEAKIIYIPGNIAAGGKYKFSFNGKFNRDEGEGAQSPTGDKMPLSRHEREDFKVIIAGSDPVYFPEWREDEFNPSHTMDYTGVNGDGSFQEPEFLFDVNLQAQNDYYYYPDMGVYGPNSSDPFLFNTPYPDENDEIIGEFACGNDYPFNSSWVGDCEGDLDLIDEDAACYQLWQRAKAIVEGPGHPDGYRGACYDLCMPPADYDIEDYAYDREHNDLFYFQLEHPDSEVNNRCDPNSCMPICARHYQWNFHWSTCREQCAPLFDPDFDANNPEDPENPPAIPTQFRQPMNWFICMHDCTDTQETNPFSECHSYCDQDANPTFYNKSCYEMFSKRSDVGEIRYQDYANPWTHSEQAIIKRNGNLWDNAVTQLRSECNRICMKGYTEARLKTQCDSNFFREDIKGGLVLAPINTLRKSTNDRFFHYEIDYRDSMRCGGGDGVEHTYCEPGNRGSVGIGSDETSTAIEIRPQSSSLEFVDIQVRVQ
ncbi:hypothetical protein ACFL38_02745 [Candidatus Omnitrophota bacterium]